MTPLHFGSSARRLLGLYERASLRTRPGRSIVFCHAWGSEHINSYRAIRFIAQRFVASGFSVLRFDYYGTGDSEGGTVESDLSGWEEDIETAVDELRELAQVRSVALFGLRLGATLAARVAARTPATVSRVVLWDPITSGAKYVDALAATTRQLRGDFSRAPAASLRSNPVELAGAFVSPGFVSALRAIDLVNTPPALPPSSVIVNTAASGMPTEADFIQPLLPAIDGCAVLKSDSHAPWTDFQQTSSALPVDTVEQIIRLCK